MKKSYVKPELYFENFQLSTSIAAGCGLALGHQMYDCNNLPGLGTLFQDTNTCTYTPDDAGFCYQTVLDSTRVFTS